MLRNNNESNEVINCMSEFNFIPKYYYKFNLFKAYKNIIKENNIGNIIQSFYEEERKKITKILQYFILKRI